MDKKRRVPNLPPFYVELIQILNGNIEKHLESEEIDLSSNPQAQILLSNLSSIQNGVDETGLESVVEEYQRFFGARPSIHLEKKLFEAFSSKDFADLSLSKYYPKVYRGLPRLYRKDKASQSCIKKEFTHLFSLKKKAVFSALCNLYASTIPEGKVLIFSWVMNDGLGDLVAGSEVLKLLKDEFQSIDVHFLALVPEELESDLPPVDNTSYIFYQKECSLQLLLEKSCDLFSSADVVLQLPTFCPFTNELKERFHQAKWECVGEYGFIESNWFHPKTENHSMGLHFLEKGILTRKSSSKRWEDVQNEEIKKWRDSNNPFYLAYLSTPTGGAIYLHALLKLLEKDLKDIDLCSPDLNWFLHYVHSQKEQKKPILEEKMNISCIQIYYKEKMCEIKIAPKGKKLRILSPSKLSQSDFQALLYLSGDWVGVRGNQSFSEAVCEKKVFFYDGRGHSRFFLKDLLAIAENRIGNCPGALGCVRGMAHHLLDQKEDVEEEWVEETFFQQKEEWMTLAMKIGFALQDPQTASGFRKLNHILVEEFSANLFFCHLVQRALYHQKYPLIEQREKAELDKFSKGLISFKDLIQSCKINFEV